MKKIINTIVICLISICAYSQDSYPYPVQKEFEGEYYKLLNNQNTVMCKMYPFGQVAMGCPGCESVMFVYRKELSLSLNKWVFYGKSTDLMIIEYDENSFVLSVQTDDELPKVNFYSKDKAKLLKMTEKKVIDYVLEAVDKF